MQLHNHTSYICAAFDLPSPVFESLCYNGPNNKDIALEPNSGFMKFMERYSSCVEILGPDRIFRWFIGDIHVVSMFINAYYFKLEYVKNTHNQKHFARSVTPRTQYDVMRFQSFISKTIPFQSMDFPVLRYYEKLIGYLELQSLQGPWESWRRGNLHIDIIDSTNYDNQAVVNIGILNFNVSERSFSMWLTIRSEDELEEAKELLIYYIRNEERHMKQLQ